MAKIMKSDTMNGNLLLSDTDDAGTHIFRLV
jgi:hypothetical protein